jgi:pyruvate formate lyase activating enzyme
VYRMRIVNRRTARKKPGFFRHHRTNTPVSPKNQSSEAGLLETFMPDGVVFNIQKYSLHDGPGIRTTVFFKGCPLRCWWCHNPESQRPDPEVHRSESRCVRCGECLQACPQRQDQESEVGADAAECSTCGACVEACPTGARKMVGSRMSVDDVLATVLQDRVFYDDSGGGVTFSGGEPLAQPEFLEALLAASRREGLDTAVDTCGFAPEDQLLGLAQLTDLFLYDLKTLDERRHEEFTGTSNRIILSNLQALGRVHKNIWIRLPIVPGWNDGEDELKSTARFVAGLRGITQVNLLPYHALHQHKTSTAADGNGRPNTCPEIDPPSPERLRELSRLFEAEGLKTIVGG